MDLSDYSLIRPDIREALDGWASGETPWCGNFVRAVLCNHLTESVGRADADNLAVLPIIVSYVHNELPYNCHGSPEIVDAWATLHSERLAAMRETATR